MMEQALEGSVSAEVYKTKQSRAGGILGGMMT